MLPVYFFITTQLSAQRIAFGENWKFTQNDVPEAYQPEFVDSEWRTLDLPHDWSIEGEYAEDNPMGDRGGYLPAGIGWYRKTVDVPAGWQGKHVEIAFDGVFRNSTVYANGRKLGTRPYGWISFAYDISQEVATDNKITFAVRVDNELQPAARWYTGSGIYAHVWMDVKDPVRLVRDGQFIRTKGEQVLIDSEVVNGSDKTRELKIISTVFGDGGKILETVTSKLGAAAGSMVVIKQGMVIPNAARWSVDHPSLYLLITEIRSGKQVLDRRETRFGFRDVEWVPETGVWIDGVNVKLRGVCNHQDAGALGAAVPDKILRFRLAQLKQMGINAIRTSHNPQTPVFYEMCDEMGILVMDEIFDGWRKKAAEDYGAHHFNEWWQRDLTDWMRRDRNHPSVIIYSLGNETHGAIAAELVAACHAIDPTRPVTSGHSASDEMDVFGVNGSSEKMGWFDKLDTTRVFIGTELTHTWQTRGYYRTKSWFRDGFPNERQRPYPNPDLTTTEIFTHDWIPSIERANRKQIFNPSYDNGVVRMNARQNIALMRDIPNFAGSFRWTGHDYIGEAGYVHGGWPFRLFMGGAIDLANFEKDLYYLYQSQWTEEPMLLLLPHWTHPKMEPGTLIPVQAYSNCDEVELFQDGHSLGKDKPGTKWNEMQCQWLVPWAPGELRAVGYRNGEAVAEQTIRSASAPARFRLSIDGEPLSPAGKDIVQVRVSSQDAEGNFYPYGENRTYFHVFGPARLRALDNGSPVDVEPHHGVNSRIGFYGLTRAYVESDGEEGAINLLAGSILGEKKLITSDTVSIHVIGISLRGERPAPNVEVLFTTDGTEPTPESELYTAPFKVLPGTRVRALIVAQGKKVMYLDERFAEDEGFVWNDPAAEETTAGEQAETAIFEGASVANDGKNFHGDGFLIFPKGRPGHVEWYQENDGEEGPAEILLRYSIGGNKPLTARLIVNGRVSDPAMRLTGQGRIGEHWGVHKATIRLQRGANMIRVEAPGNTKILIDEIIVR